MQQFGSTHGIIRGHSGKRWLRRSTSISLETTTLGLALIRIVSFVIRTESTA
ncbi:MAG: hypothetical protein VXV85_04690 [Candidatus Thermoplasmatota archaeon]|nr:hypothetical protein [Candidatus Thermoplasmatota archaeon]